MPYGSINELPSSVKDHLPKHAQEIYKEAYNSAWDEYKDAKDRRGAPPGRRRRTRLPGRRSKRNTRRATTETGIARSNRPRDHRRYWTTRPAPYGRSER